MKRIAWILLFLAGLAQGGERVSLVFDQVPLMDLARIAYGEMAAMPVVFTAEAVKAPETVSVTLRSITKDQAVSQVGQLLKSAGYSAETRSGVVWIGKAAEEARDELVYRPRHRAASYLMDLTAALFKQGSFSVQRGISQQPANQGPVLAQGGTPAQNQPQVVDSGTSAFSLLDKQPDVLVFKGTAEDIRRFQKLMAQLDTPTPELLVKAVVFEVSTDTSERSAIAVAAQLLGGKLGLTLGSATAGDYSAVFKGAGLQVIVDALASDTRFKVVSAPQLRVRSGAAARLTVGADTPVLGQASLDKNGNPVQSVDYKPSGVILDLKPQIGEEATDLAIGQQISNFIATTTGVNNSPTLIKRELSTSVTVKDGDVLVLGGLDENKDTQEKRGLSFLPDWLHAGFANRSRSEILLILQAQRL